MQSPSITTGITHKEAPSGRAEPQGVAGMQPPADSEMGAPQQEFFGMPSLPGPGGPPPQK